MLIRRAEARKACYILYSLTSNTERLCLAAILHRQQDALCGDCRQVRPARSTAALQPLTAGVLPQAQAPPTPAVHMQHDRGTQQRHLH